VTRICSFLAQSDLLEFRRINDMFQEEATRRLRQIHKHIPLKTGAQIHELVSCIQRRGSLNLLPTSPFSAFKVDLNFSPQLLEKLGARLGEHIQRYWFEMLAIWLKNENAEDMGGKAVILLSHSPELTHLQLGGSFELYVSDQALLRLPDSFPRLKYIGISSELLHPETPQLPRPLIDLVVSRAPNLKTFRFPAAPQDMIVRILDFLLQTRPGNLPKFSFEEFQPLTLDTLPFIEELISLKLPFTDISVRLKQCGYGASSIVSTWLELQRDSLTDLHIELSYGITSEFFHELRILKNLSMKFPYTGNRFVSFIENPFPVLEKVVLENYQETFDMFRTCSMDSVQHLHLRNMHQALRNLSWNTNFPNLTTLHIELNHTLAHVFCRTLGYILTHLTRVHHLDLELSNEPPVYLHSRFYSYGEPPREEPEPESLAWDCWSILTGGVRQSVLNWTKSKRELLAAAGALEEPKNGIFRVPSLRNMTGELIVFLAV